jgi:hypothetical protein
VREREREKETERERKKRKGAPRDRNAIPLDQPPPPPPSPHSPSQPRTVTALLTTRIQRHRSKTQKGRWSGRSTRAEPGGAVRPSAEGNRAIDGQRAAALSRSHNAPRRDESLVARARGEKLVGERVAERVAKRVARARGESSWREARGGACGRTWRNVWRELKWQWWFCANSPLSRCFNRYTFH